MPSQPRVARVDPSRKAAPSFSESLRARTILVGLQLIAMTFGLCAGVPSRASGIRQDFSVANGTVYAQTLLNNVLYIGGNFSQVGPRTGGGVLVDTVLGSPDPPYPEVNGSVYVVLSDERGGRYIGGRFSSVGGIECPNLAHILPDLSVDFSWRPGTDGPVHAMSLVPGVSHSTLYVGGSFSAVNGQARASLAAVDAASGSVLPWNPGVDDSVSSLVGYSSLVYVGGAFTHIRGRSIAHLAAVDDSTGVPITWNPRVDGAVYTLLMGIYGSCLYVGGDFHYVGSGRLLRNDMAAFPLGNNYIPSDSPNLWNPGADGPCYAMCLGPTTNIEQVAPVCVGGGWSNLADTSAAKLAEVDGSYGSVVWQPYLPVAPDAPVYCVACTRNAVFAGGNFHAGTNQTTVRYGVVSYQANGGLTAWNPRPSGFVRALCPVGADMYLGGDFTSVGGKIRRNLAALDATTGQLTSWAPDADAQVLALCASDGKIYAGGDFSFIGQSQRMTLAAMDTAGAVLPWDPEPNNEVSALKFSMDGKTLYVGGNFSSIAGQARSNLAAFDATNPDPMMGVRAFDPEPDGQVYAISESQDRGTLFVGGRFANVAGQARGNLAMFDVHDLGVPVALLPADAMADGAVDALSLGADGKTLYAGGEFSMMGGMPRAHLAALDVTFPSSPLSLLPWNPGADGPVYAISQILDGRRFGIGGQFLTVDSQTMSHVSVFDTTKSGPNAGLLADTPGTDGAVYSLAQDPTALYVGGAFRSIGGVLQSYLAALTGTQVSAVAPAPRVARFALRSLSPNPARGTVRIEYELAAPGAVKLEILDTRGARVRTLFDGRAAAGVGTARWDGRGTRGERLPSGAYFVRITAGGRSAVGKVITFN